MAIVISRDRKAWHSINERENLRFSSVRLSRRASRAERSVKFTGLMIT